MNRLLACIFFIISTIALGAPRPKIIFVLVDDMGYADLGCMGSPDIKTPHIDRIAKEGVKFTDFYANAPVCTPTRCGFITGRCSSVWGSSSRWATRRSSNAKRMANG